MFKDTIALQSRTRTVFESVFLASYGGAGRPVPPYLLHTMKICCTNLPQVYSKGGVCRQSPKETCANAGKRGKPVKATSDSRRNFIYHEKTVGWRSKQAEVGFDVFSTMIDACLSLSNTLCSLFINKFLMPCCVGCSSDDDYDDFDNFWTFHL